ncbi:MAG: penicillin-binding protein activator [Rhodospirillales bacterium]|nr:penicillin-binding protein activator [Rhodospirillales bacterium]
MAVLFLTAACQSSQLTPWTQGEKPIAAASQSQQAPEPASTPTQPEPRVAAVAPAQPSDRQAALPGQRRQKPPVPSLAPLLDRPFPDLPQPDPAQPRLVPLVPPSESPRIALLLPLTGAQSKIGQSLLNAAQLALFDFADDDFELLIHDTKGTEEGAAEAMALAIGDGASLVLGPLLAPSVRAVTPAARAAGIPVLAFSSDRSVAGDGVFTMGFFPEAEVNRVVAYARSRGVLRFAAIVPDDAYGARVVDALRASVEAANGLIARIQYYSPYTQDFSGVVKELARYESRRGALLAQRKELEARGDELALRALKRLEGLQTIGELPFEALLVADGGKRLQAIAAHLPFYDIDPARVRMLGTGQWDEPGIGAEPALAGGWFAAPPPRARADFEIRYASVYGRKPPRLATLAYDATALSAVMARAEGGPDFSVSALTVPSGFFGRDGIFRFGLDGAVERGLAIVEVEPKGFKVVDKAPDAFGQAMY